MTDHTYNPREDTLRVSAFIIGWWPGLEDGIGWGDNDNELNPVYQAARRLNAYCKAEPIPTFPEELITDRRHEQRRKYWQARGLEERRVVDRRYE